MRRFLQSKVGVLSLCGFTLVMAFLCVRILSRPERRLAGVSTGLSQNPVSPIAPKSTAEVARGLIPAAAPKPSGKKAKSAKEGTTLVEELAYLDRVKDAPGKTRSDRDRDGLKVTRRRTASSQSSRKPSAEQEVVLGAPKGALRLQGRNPPKEEHRSGEAIQAEQVPVQAQPEQKSSQLEPPISEDVRFVPFGRPIKCELIFTIDSIMEETPLVGLVIEPVYNNGHLVIPAGAELHGMARPDRLRDRIFSSKDWILVLPRENARPSGRQLQVKGLALDRFETMQPNLGWGITDGSNGLRGTVIRSMDAEEIKRFAATFLSAAAVTLQEQQGGGRNTRRIANTPGNAVLQGISSTLEDLSRKIAEEIEKNGVFIRVPGGKQFYFYPQQSIHPEKATVP